MKTDERGHMAGQAPGLSAGEMAVAKSAIDPRGERRPACASGDRAVGFHHQLRRRGSPWRPAAWVVAWFALSSAGPAAAEPSVAEIAVARRLFREAAELRQAEKWEAAAQKLREAIALKETPGLRFHLAHCEEKLGRLVEAQLEYDRADELIAGGARAPDVLPLLDAARAALRDRVPTLRIRLLGEAKDVRLSIDDIPLSQRLLGEAVPVNPGEHLVKVEAPGRGPSLFTVRLEEGEDRNLDAALGEPTPVPPPVPSPASARASGPQTADATGSGPLGPPSGGFGLREGVLVGEGVVALAGAGLGVYFLLERNDAAARADAASRKIDARDSASSACGTEDAPAGCEDLQRAADDKRRSGDWALGSFIGAGVGAAAFVTTWLLWPRHASTRGAGHILVVPAVGSGAGAVVVGQF